jgi:hypothetical protein
MLNDGRHCVIGHQRVLGTFFFYSLLSMADISILLACVNPPIVASSAQHDLKVRLLARHGTMSMIYVDLRCCSRCCSFYPFLCLLWQVASNEAARLIGGDADEDGIASSGISILQRYVFLALHGTISPTL